MSERTSGAGAARSEAGDFAAALMPAAFGMWAPMLGANTTWNADMQLGFARLGNEWLEFVMRRTKEDLTLPQRLCACRSPEDVWGVYVGYWQQLLEDYRQEYAVMAKLGSRLADNSAARIREQARLRDGRSHAKAA